MAKTRTKAELLPLFARWHVMTEGERRGAGLPVAETEWAAGVGKHRNTLQTWKRSDEFAALVDEAKAERGEQRQEDADLDDALERLEQGDCDLEAVYPHLKAALIRKFMAGQASQSEVTTVKELWLRDLAERERAARESDLNDLDQTQLERETVALLADETVAAAYEERGLGG